MPDGPSSADLSVLVVEDEARLRELLLRAIPQMGFAPAGARSAEEALRLMEKSPSPIMLLDLNLPGMSGMELFGLLRQRWPQTQVVILTGFGDLEAAREAIRLDVVDFLTKPCSLGDLEVALDRARKRLGPPRPDVGPDAGPDSIVSDNAGPPTLDDIERQTILAALERHRGNRAATAAELGISLRTLYYRLAEYQRQGYRLE
jgi:DNA-binding NtrC family response regulator